jgi:iron(III) transport system substrate-binding protein
VTHIVTRPILVMGLVATVLASACSSAATPQPTAGPTAAPVGSPTVQPKPTDLAGYATYQGADRTAILEACATKEGQLFWTSELAGGVITAMKAAFQKKYPAIAVSEQSANGSDFVPRMQQERQAKKYTVDAFEMSSDSQLLIATLDMRQPYWSPALATYKDDAKEAASNGLVYQTVDRYSFMGFGYNTKLLPASAVPSSYADLLKPELKGKMVMSGSGSSGAQLFGIFVTTLGADFPTKLKAQNYTIQQVSGRGLLDLITAGEVAGSPTIYQSHVKTDAAKGAPVAWVPLSPVSANAGGSSIAKDAPHPCAAVLFTDFILGAEGRAVLDSFFYANPADKFNFQLSIPGAGMTPDAYNAKIKEWDGLMRTNATSK